MNDDILIKKAQAGDEKAFTQLVEKYQLKLWFYIQKISFLSPNESEEVLQEVFIKIWKNLQDFKARSKFSTWAYAITRNHTFRCMQIQRHYQNKVNIDDLQEVLSDAGIESFIKDIDREHYDKKIIADALTTLPSHFREIIILKYWENLSYSEISDVMKIPEGTVATYLNRAKKQIEQKVSSQYNKHI